MGPLLSCPLGARPQPACPYLRLNSLHELPRHQTETPCSPAELPKGDYMGGSWVSRCWPEAEGHAFEVRFTCLVTPPLLESVLAEGKAQAT